jgi:hypothetical protein
VHGSRPARIPWPAARECTTVKVDDGVDVNVAVDVKVFVNVIVDDKVKIPGSVAVLLHRHPSSQRHGRDRTPVRRPYWLCVLHSTVAVA